MTPFEDVLLMTPTAFAASPNSEWPKSSDDADWLWNKVEPKF